MKNKNEFHFYVQIPSIYGNYRKDGQLSRHRVGYFKAFNKDGKVYLTGSFIANKEDRFDLDKAKELAEQRRPIGMVEQDFNGELDIRDILKRMKMHTRGQDLSLCLSPLYRLRKIQDLKGGMKIVETVRQSETACLERNNYELNRIVRLAKNVSNN